MFVGFSCAIAFIAAWAAIFVPYFVTNRSKILRTFLVTIAAGVVTIAPLSNILIAPLLTAPFIFTLLLVLAVVAIGAVEIATLFMPSRKSLLPAVSGFYALLTVPAMWKLGIIAYGMWARTVARGSVPRREVSPLAWIHLLFIILSLLLTAILWFRLRRGTLRAIRISAIASGVFIISAGISFFYTMPRSGGDLIILWIFVVPGFILAGIVLLISCVLVLVIHHGQQS